MNVRNAAYIELLTHTYKCVREAKHSFHLAPLGVYFFIILCCFNENIMLKPNFFRLLCIPMCPCIFILVCISHQMMLMRLAFFRSFKHFKLIKLMSDNN